MKLISLMAGSLLLTSVAIAEEAPNAANGQKLFNESGRCLECHGVEKFTSNDRKVVNLLGLESVVRRCDARLTKNWYEDQILDVVEYLNQAYYKFEKNPKQSKAVEADSGKAVTEKVEKPVVVANSESE